MPGRSPTPSPSVSSRSMIPRVSSAARTTCGYGRRVVDVQRQRLDPNAKRTPPRDPASSARRNAVASSTRASSRLPVSISVIARSGRSASLVGVVFGQQIYGAAEELGGGSQVQLRVRAGAGRREPLSRVTGEAVGLSRRTAPALAGSPAARSRWRPTISSGSACRGSTIDRGNCGV